MTHERPPGTDDATIEAVGKLSEAFECIERCRGLLYSFHQLSGHADLLLGDAVDKLRDAGHGKIAEVLEERAVGRNVLEGRWTFQIVEEYDELYYEPVRGEVRAIEDELVGGRRHIFEAELKDRRRTAGARGHERRPPV